MTDWAALDRGLIIPIVGATCPAEVMAGTHYHGTHGPVGVAKREPGGAWEALGDEVPLPC